jgi:hypothetical protein
MNFISELVISLSSPHHNQDFLVRICIPFLRVCVYPWCGIKTFRASESLNDRDVPKEGYSWRLYVLTIPVEVCRLEG